MGFDVDGIFVDTIADASTMSDTESYTYNPGGVAEDGIAISDTQDWYRLIEDWAWDEMELTVTQEVNNYFAKWLLDDIQVGDTVADVFVAVDTLLDSIDVADTGTSNSVLASVLPDGIALGDTLTPNQVLQLVAQDSIAFVFRHTTDTDAFTGVIVNTRTFANTEYTGYNFNSICRFMGDYYGAKIDGIYKLTGTDDDGTSISASVMTGLTDFGAKNRYKGLPESFLGLRNDGSMVMKVTTKDRVSGDKKEHWYQITDTSAAIRNVRSKFGKGARAVYWQFELVNNAGADFDLDFVEVYPVILSRSAE
jgi:hypothetical protein